MNFFAKIWNQVYTLFRFNKFKMSMQVKKAIKDSIKLPDDIPVIINLFDINEEVDRIVDPSIDILLMNHLTGNKKDFELYMDWVIEISEEKIGKKIQR